MIQQPKLSSNTRCYLGSRSFEGDAFQRKDLATKLTNYLERLNDGAVLAIDGQWGEGKTWFGQNWNEYLKEQEHTTIYIDAFEQDYIEDPFILITSEIFNVIEDDNPCLDGLKTSAIETTKALLPMATKALFNFGGRILLGSSDVSSEIKEAIEAGQSISSELSSKWISEKLDSFANEKIIMEEFKNQLSIYAKELDKPLVIFVDELDRCKPTFAISLIERIKHFFDIPNIVFVLLLNRQQLEKAVKGVYGSETDSSLYLDKFINFYFKLPKDHISNHRSETNIKKFIESTLSKYNFSKDESTESFKIYILNWSAYFNLSLRDIEKCVALFAFASPVSKDTIWILVYFIILKVKKKNLFNLLTESSPEAHKTAKSMIEDFIKKAKRLEDTTFETRVLPLYFEWHLAHETEFSEVGENFEKLVDGQQFWATDRKNLFSELSKLIDIDIER